MKYLVTGGEASSLNNVSELLSRGAEVRVLDKLCTGQAENIEPFKANAIPDVRGDCAVFTSCETP
jgi:UDP-glucose 4-epimerase